MVCAPLVFFTTPQISAKSTPNFEGLYFIKLEVKILILFLKLNTILHFFYQIVLHFYVPIGLKIENKVINKAYIGSIAISLSEDSYCRIESDIYLKLNLICLASFIKKAMISEELSFIV